MFSLYDEKAGRKGHKFTNKEGWLKRKAVRKATPCSQGSPADSPDESKGSRACLDLDSEEGVWSSPWPQLPEKPHSPSLQSMLCILLSLRKGPQDLFWLCSLQWGFSEVPGAICLSYGLVAMANSLTVPCPSLNSAHTFNAAALSLKLCSVPDSPPAGLQSQAVPLCWLPVTKGALGIKVSHPPSAWERQPAEPQEQKQWLLGQTQASLIFSSSR